MEPDELAAGLGWYMAIVTGEESTIHPLIKADVAAMLAAQGGKPTQQYSSPAVAKEALLASLGAADARKPRPPHIPIDHPDVGILYLP